MTLGVLYFSRIIFYNYEILKANAPTVMHLRDEQIII